MKRRPASSSSSKKGHGGAASGSSSGSRNRCNNGYRTGQHIRAYEPQTQKIKQAVILAVNGSSGAPVQTGTASTKMTELYVHWVGHDRRLDGWISVNRVVQTFAPGQTPGTSTEGAADESQPSAATHSQQGSKSDGEDDEALEHMRELEEGAKLKSIAKLEMDGYLIDAWYFSPFPVDAARVSVCVFCLSFFKTSDEYAWHKARCLTRCPPGNEILRLESCDVAQKEGPTLAVWEVDGGIARTYCENLSLLSKLFLDHKSLRHPVHLFLFYLLTEIRDDGYHIAGYFSKEKYSTNNLSCIMILPHHQRKGYGKFLIRVSYALSRLQNKLGTPERPLSDLGKASYLSFWQESLMPILQRIICQQPIDTPVVSKWQQQLQQQLAQTAAGSMAGSIAGSITGSIAEAGFGSIVGTGAEAPAGPAGPGPAGSAGPAISLDELCSITGFQHADVVTTLCAAKVLHFAKPSGEGSQTLPFIYVPNMDADLLPSNNLTQNLMAQVHWMPYDAFCAPFEYNPDI